MEAVRDVTLCGGKIIVARQPGCEFRGEFDKGQVNTIRFSRLASQTRVIKTPSNRFDGASCCRHIEVTEFQLTGYMGCRNQHRSI